MASQKLYSEDVINAWSFRKRMKYANNVWQEFSGTLRQIKEDLNVPVLESSPDHERMKLMLKYAMSRSTKYGNMKWVKNMIVAQDFEALIERFLGSTAPISFKQRDIKSVLHIFGQFIHFYAVSSEAWIREILEQKEIEHSFQGHGDYTNFAIRLEFADKWFDRRMFWNIYFLNVVMDGRFICGWVSAFFMIFCSKLIEESLNVPQKELKVKVDEFNAWLECCRTHNKSKSKFRDVVRFLELNDLVSLRGKVRAIGLQMVSAFEQKLLISGGYNPAECFYIFGKYYFMQKEMLDARKCFVLTIYRAPSFIMLLLALRYLGRICKSSHEFEIGYKCLKMAKILCSDIHLRLAPSMHGQILNEGKRLFRELKNVSCAYCGRNDALKLHSCTGCMAIFYCNKRCQKKHWKEQHRNECSKHWIDDYKLLKQTVIFKRY